MDALTSCFGQECRYGMACYESFTLPNLYLSVSNNPLPLFTTLACIGRFTDQNLDIHRRSKTIYKRSSYLGITINMLLPYADLLLLQCSLLTTPHLLYLSTYIRPNPIY